MTTTTDTGITIEPELYEVLADLAHTAPHWIVEAQPELALFDVLQPTQPQPLTDRLTTPSR